VADRHEHGPEDDRLALAEDPVGEHAAEERREVDEAGVQAVDLGGERLVLERAEHRFQRPLDRVEAEHVLPDVRVEEQVVDHVQHEE